LLFARSSILEKLIEFQNYITESNNDFFSLENRLGTYLVSINSFFENFYLGIIVKPLTYENGFIKDFGQHSMIFDTFSIYGVLIGLLNLYLIIAPFIFLKKRFFSNKKIIFAFFISILIFSFFNNSTINTSFLAFFIFPFMLKYNSLFNLRNFQFNYE